MESMAGNGGNRTLERVAAILDAVGTSAVSASELARRTGLSVSTTHRLALSMADYGFLSRDADGGFRMGERFVRSALENAAAPVLDELRRATGETTQLWIRRGDERVCVLSLDGPHELRATLPVGARLPLPAGSSGRLLAGDEAALADVQRQGWVESVGLRTPGLGSVSAPVVLDGVTIGAVCLAMPLARVQASPGEDFGNETVAAARRIAEAMAGRLR
ncbi:putative transcriptional regulator, IclR family protein [Zafaria cholistanensis]|uniref:Putative transcriptional regulator, IclR family protein n=1 Tax=Zafaria cholistanensis TaxID=1682741 RepID=A0A5A7NUV7_9MICC|nr:helix-turn-helix domain-containing protein [Zafaria cholistanensis]GER23718.1 putative transcriptional regulator, IclR family protein [Zafaria cholistanensis]